METIRPMYPCYLCSTMVPHDYNLKYGAVYTCDECAESMDKPRQHTSPKPRGNKSIGGPLTVGVYSRWELEQRLRSGASGSRGAVFEGIRDRLRKHLIKAGDACFLYDFAKTLQEYDSPQERYNYARNAVVHSRGEFILEKVNDRNVVIKS